MDIAIVGATGFVGSHLVPHLAEAGHRVIAISRTGRRLPGWTDAVEARAADVTTGAGLDEALAGDRCGRAPGCHPARVRRPALRGRQRGRHAARRRGGCSAPASAASCTCRCSVWSTIPKLGYLRSKARGEQLVRESSLGWVVLRPSLMFGVGDGFFNIVKTTLRYWSPGVVAIPGNGDTRFQPLAADDLAIAVERSLTDSDRAGSVYELGGPEWLTYRQIVDEVMRVTGMRRLKLPDPDPAHQRADRRNRPAASHLPGHPRPDRLAATPELHRSRCLREGVRRQAAQAGPLVPAYLTGSRRGRILRVT